MNSGKIVAAGTGGRTDGEIEGSRRGPRGPKKTALFLHEGFLNEDSVLSGRNLPCKGPGEKCSRFKPKIIPLINHIDQLHERAFCE